MQRVVITGGPATGKTSLIDALNRKGHLTFPEVARAVIKEQLALNTAKVPWLDVTAFSQLVLERQKKDFLAAKAPLSFYDRGIPDIMGYLDFGDLPHFEALITTAQKFTYEHIFLLPPWEEIYENDAERREDFSEATQLFHALNNAYLQLDYQPIIVPKGSIEDRLNFILQHIS